VSSVSKLISHTLVLPSPLHADAIVLQLACDIRTEYPQLWPAMCAAWSSTVAAAAPFMLRQASQHHFELFGLDFMADTSGRVWLLEINRCPGLASTRENFAADEAFYSSLVSDMLGIVLAPLGTAADSNVEAVGRAGSEQERSSVGAEGQFQCVSDARTDVSTDGTKLWQNVLELAAYAKRCRAADAVQAVSRDCDVDNALSS
jgi:Tubulin-tyrosine ligase family